MARGCHAFACNCCMHVYCTARASTMACACVRAGAAPEQTGTCKPFLVMS